MTPDNKAIEEILRQMEDAWNAYDSVRLASLFAADATFIQIFGGQLDGREAIQASHRAIFDTIYKGSHARFTLRSVRFIRPEVALIFCQAHLQFHEGNQAREMATRPTMVVVKDQGRWEIVALQNTRISEMPSAAQAAARLTS